MTPHRPRIGPGNPRQIGRLNYQISEGRLTRFPAIRVLRHPGRSRDDALNPPLAMATISLVASPNNPQHALGASSKAGALPRRSTAA